MNQSDSIIVNTCNESLFSDRTSGTVHQSFLKTAFSLWKRIKIVFRPHSGAGEICTRDNRRGSGIMFEDISGRKITNYCDVILFEKLRFLNALHPNLNTMAAAFSHSSGSEEHFQKDSVFVMDECERFA